MRKIHVQAVRPGGLHDPGQRHELHFASDSTTTVVRLTDAELADLRATLASYPARLTGQPTSMGTVYTHRQVLTDDRHNRCTDPECYGPICTPEARLNHPHTVACGPMRAESASSTPSCMCGSGLSAGECLERDAHVNAGGNSLTRCGTCGAPSLLCEHARGRADGDGAAIAE